MEKELLFKSDCGTKLRCKIVPVENGYNVIYAFNDASLNDDYLLTEPLTTEQETLDACVKAAAYFGYNPVKQ